MSDDSLDGMPEFDKPENIPVVIIPNLKPRCSATTKAGHPCSIPPIHGETLCLGHNKAYKPEERARWRRKDRVIKVGRTNIKVSSKHVSKDELLGILTERLYIIKQKYGDQCTPVIEEMICNVARTIALVYKIEMADGGALRTVPPLEYEVKEADARAAS